MQQPLDGSQRYYIEFKKKTYLKEQYAMWLYIKSCTSLNNLLIIYN